jgi:hypothetical protein
MAGEAKFEKKWLVMSLLMMEEYESICMTQTMLYHHPS